MLSLDAELVEHMRCKPVDSAPALIRFPLKVIFSRTGINCLFVIPSVCRSLMFMYFRGVDSKFEHPVANEKHFAVI